MQIYLLNITFLVPGLPAYWGLLWGDLRHHLQKVSLDQSISGVFGLMSADGEANALISNVNTIYLSLA